MEGIYDNILVVIPSLNPDDKLMKLLEDLKAGGFPHVLVVNDGSAEDYAPYFQRAERNSAARCCATISISAKAGR